MILKTKFNLTTQILFALIIGLVIGVALNLIGDNSSPAIKSFIDNYIVQGFFSIIGKLFIKSIKMLVVPLVLISLICGVTGIGDLKKLGRVGGKTLFFYLLTTSVAIAIALLISNIVDPGNGLNLGTGATEFASKEAPPLSAVLINIIPANPFKAFSAGNMLQVIFFALLTGIAITALGKKAKHVMILCEELNNIIMRMVSFIMLAAPIGIFSLIGKVFAEQGLSALLPLLKYFITVLIALAFHLLFIYCGALKLFARVSIITFFKKFYSTMLVAFSTASSNATIPVTMKTAVEKLGVSRGIASFSIPFGATINMDGTAIMQGVAVVFIAQVYGIDLSMTDFLTVIITATLASIGTAGVPGVGLITLSMVLTQVNLPVEGIALVMGVDRLLDMSRSALNICGDSIVSIIVAKGEKEFDQTVYNNLNAGLEEDDALAHLDEDMHQGHDILVQMHESEELD